MTGRNTTSRPRHFLDLSELGAGDLRALIDAAAVMKARRAGEPKGMIEQDAPLAGHVLAMLFEKPSTRTRVSFEVGMRQMGGEVVVMSDPETQIGERESLADTARVLSRYVDIVMLRANSHDHLTELAAHSTIPVINGLTDDTHPCQIMADILTFEEHIGPIAGRKIAWVGDGNNVSASWIEASARFGFTLTLACPPELSPQRRHLDWADKNGGDVTLCDDPRAAVADADCIVTDTWVSMGQKDGARRKQLLQPYQVTESLMADARSGAIFMHCLPAHRGEEVAGEVIDGPRSVVFDEAENRLHIQKAILAWCAGVDLG